MTTGPARFPAELAALAERATTIDLRPCEAQPNEQSLAVLEASVLEMLIDAQRLLHEVHASCETEPRTVRVTATDLPTPPAPAGGPLESVEELAVMAIIELRQCAQHITDGRRAEPMSRVIWCDTAIRRARRGLAAVENAIADAHHLPPRLESQSLLRTALRIRRCYARFGAAVTAEGAPDAARLREVMRRLGTRLAVLIGRDEFLDMRIRDRATVRALQRRVLDWLRLGDLANPLTGVRIWQDLRGAVEIFRQISRRQELIAHDEALLATSWAALQQTSPGPVAPALLAEVLRLEGLDASLDQLLSSGAPATREALLPILERLRPRAGDTSARGDVQPPRARSPNPRGDSSHGPR